MKDLLPLQTADGGPCHFTALTSPGSWETPSRQNYSGRVPETGFVTERRRKGRQDGSSVSVANSASPFTVVPCGTSGQ